MRSLKLVVLGALLAALGVTLASDALAQRGPRDGRRHNDSAKVRPNDRVRDHHAGRHAHAFSLQHYFSTNPECLELLLSQMSEEDQAAYTRASAALRELNADRKTIHARMRAAREAGDTAAFRAAQQELRELGRQAGQLNRVLNELFRKYHDVIVRIRKSCGDRPDPNDRGDDRDDRTDSRLSISPNPVPTGSTTTLTVTLQSEASVAVTVLGEDGAVLRIPASTLGAGEHQIALDVSGLTRGMYMVQVVIGDRRQMLKLMIN